MDKIIGVASVALLTLAWGGEAANQTGASAPRQEPATVGR